MSRLIASTKPLSPKSLAADLRAAQSRTTAPAAQPRSTPPAAEPHSAPPPAPPAPPTRPNQDQSELRKRAVNLFTFLRELVSLRTTVVRSCESYDRVLWIDQVPREGECDCIAFRPAKKRRPMSAGCRCASRPSRSRLRRRRS